MLKQYTILFLFSFVGGSDNPCGVLSQVEFAKYISRFPFVDIFLLELWVIMRNGIVTCFLRDTNCVDMMILCLLDISEVSPIDSIMGTRITMWLNLLSGVRYVHAFMAKAISRKW